MSRKVWLICFVILVAACARVDADVLYVFDKSGSMTWDISGELAHRPDRRIDIAQRVFLDVVAQRPPQEQSGLVLFPVENEGCTPEYAVPLGPDNAARIQARMRAIQIEPMRVSKREISLVGGTPLAKALDMAVQIAAHAEAKLQIVVITDGEETCHGDPLAVIRKARENGIDIVVHVVGFTVDAAVRGKLEALAREGAGTYYHAADEEQLRRALSRIEVGLDSRSSRVLTVSHDGSSEYRSIQQAIDAAVSGDTVLVHPGAYTETLTFRSGITLSGTDVDRCRVVLVPGARHALIAEDCSGGVIRDLAFDGGGHSGKEPDGIVVVNSTMQVQRCNIQNFKDGRAMWVTGVRSQGVLLNGNTCHDNRVGIQLRDGAKASVTDNKCADNQYDGISLLGTGTRGVLSSNSCRRNGRHGIMLWDGASALVENNTCAESRNCGIIASGASTHVAATQNRCERNAKTGIWLSDRASGSLRANECLRNEGNGIVVIDKASAEVEHNKCIDNGEDGILFQRYGSGSVRANVVSGSGRYGIVVHCCASAQVAENQCRDNGLSGILFQTVTLASANGNTCEGNEHGIQVLGTGTTPTIGANTCRNNRGWGIFCEAGSSPKISEDNNCTGNFEGAVRR